MGKQNKKTWFLLALAAAGLIFVVLQSDAVNNAEPIPRPDETESVELTSDALPPASPAPAVCDVHQRQKDGPEMIGKDQ